MANKKPDDEPQTQDSPEEVEVAFGDEPSDTATLLLAAAEDLELEPGVVKTTSTGTFIVPSDVAKKAGVKPVEDNE